ncbi:MAG: hypothetical protein A3I64_09540 [Burkholderiales bacterium RIFCSPLOWO2_02_FULL_67_64]|nr:MAG: hypothetical protein A3I64_09540 [Burkholderiales bacterium RIFCSPLOWO2_02_FULL_67_64]
MSTTPSATQGHSTNASASASATGATRNGAGKPAREASGTATGADLFSNLLSLLSAAVEPPAGAEALNDSSAAGDAQADPNANPLAALLTWPGPGSALAPTPPSGALAAQAMGGAAGKPLPSADAPAADPALQGMTLLDTPAEPDAQTLAALGRGTAAAPAGPAQAPGKAPPALGQVPTTRSLQWRSAGAMAQHAVAAPSATASAHQQHSAAQAVDVGPGQTTASLTAMRSTVALHDRMGRTSTTEAPALAAAGAAAGPFVLGAAGGAGAQTDAGAGGGGAQPGALAEGGEAELTTDEAWAESAQEAALNGEADTEAEVVSHWGTQNLRHASLRVGEGGEDAIDIQLSMSGQEVQVDFRTDSAEARASLAQNAGESLAELLQRGGIQLGGVSVGGGQGQASGGPGQRPAEAGVRPARAGGAASGVDSATTAPTAPRPRADGSQPLDLFV